MNPKPFSPLNHFTVPCVMCSPLGNDVKAHTVRALRCGGFVLSSGRIPEKKKRPLVTNSAGVPTHTRKPTTATESQLSTADGNLTDRRLVVGGAGSRMAARKPARPDRRR